jgi:hypothetical protein
MITVISGERIKGKTGSRLMNATGRQKRNEIVAISVIVLSIRRMIRGLISFIKSQKRYGKDKQK